ncbi:MAG: ABC transporter permease [Polyangiaceae bacterium]
MIPIAYNVRNLAVRKATTAAAAAGLGLVVFVFASVMMLANGVKQATHRAVDPNGVIALRKGSSVEIESGLDESSVALLGAMPGVARSAAGQPLAVGELVVLVILDKREGGLSNVVIRGVPENVLALRPSLRVKEGRAPRPGTNEVMVGSSIRPRIQGLDPGKVLEIRKNRPLQIVGVFEDDSSSNESEIWGDLHVVQAAFAQQGTVSSVRVRLESPGAFDRFAAAVAATPQLHLNTWRESEFGDRQTQGTAIFLSGMGTLVALLFSIGAVIGAMITMHATVEQRQREIGTLRAIGFTRTQVLASFLLESIVLALVGGVFGAGASLLMSLKRISMMNVSTWSELSFKFEPTPGILLAAIALAVVMGACGGLLPAVRTARINPIQAMRGA